jgi:hypothetical protein
VLFTQVSQSYGGLYLTKRNYKMKMAPLQKGHELVEFECGAYGIRKREGMNYKYLDVRDEKDLYWWGEANAHKYGKGSKVIVIAAYNRFCDKGRVIQSFDDDWPQNEESPPSEPKRKSIWRLFF